MAKTKNTKLDSIIVMGIEITDNTVYEIVPKRPDNSAPDLYVKMGSEKHLNPNVSNLVSFVAVDGYWNTGFYPTSECFRTMGLDPEEAEQRAEEYKKFIVDPMVKFDKRFELLLTPSTDNHFYDGLMSNLYIGKQFNTKDPQQRLELYLAIIGLHLAPAGYRTQDEKEKGLVDENHSAFATAQYAVEAKEKVRSTEQKRATNKVVAIGKFYNILTSNKKELVAILNYLGLRFSVQETDDQITVRVLKWFDESFDNCEEFVEALAKTEDSKEFKEELKIVDVLRNERGMNFMEKAGREYFFEGVYVGVDEKQIARTIARDPSLLQAFYSKQFKK